MICAECGKNDDKVIDSREDKTGLAIRRRRECKSCKKRFTTWEKTMIMDEQDVSIDGIDLKAVIFTLDNLERSLRYLKHQIGIDKETP